MPSLGICWVFTTGSAALVCGGKFGVTTNSNRFLRRRSCSSPERLYGWVPKFQWIRGK
jgi:hypothetical protein